MFAPPILSSNDMCHNFVTVLEKQHTPVLNIHFDMIRFDICQLTWGIKLGFMSSAVIWINPFPVIVNVGECRDKKGYTFQKSDSSTNLC